jgi:hypothetical protein
MDVRSVMNAVYCSSRLIAGQNVEERKVIVVRRWQFRLSGRSKSSETLNGLRYLLFPPGNAQSFSYLQNDMGCLVELLDPREVTCNLVRVRQGIVGQ